MQADSLSLGNVVVNRLVSVRGNVTITTRSQLQLPYFLGNVTIIGNASNPLKIRSATIDMTRCAVHVAESGKSRRVQT